MTDQPTFDLDAILPAWEANYEPGNVSDYLIGYANSEAAAKGAAIAWVLSQSDKDPASLEWVEMPTGDQHDHWYDLIENHADGIPTDTGINVRHRLVAGIRDTARTTAGQQPSPCSSPVPCEDGGEPCDRHEREQAHSEGEHAFCGPTCETEFPSDMLRNTILFRAIPGSARMLDELLRRAVVGQPATQQQNQLTATDRAFLNWALDQAAHVMATDGAQFDNDGHASMARLRRVADEADR